MNAFSSIMRRSKSKPNKAFCLVMGPLMLAPKNFCEYGGLVDCVNRGLRELRSWLLNWAKRDPWNKSVPGFVKISILPKPGRSYSGEKGFELIRISRIDDLFGRFPPVNPSM